MVKLDHKSSQVSNPLIPNINIHVLPKACIHFLCYKLGEFVQRYFLPLMIISIIFLTCIFHCIVTLWGKIRYTMVTVEAYKV